MIMEFYPTSFSVLEKDKKCFVRMFGRSVSGEVICVEDEYAPHFFVAGKFSKEDINGIKKLSDEKGSVLEVEKVKKNINEEESDAVKITVSSPNVMYDLAKHLERKFKTTAYEYNIPVERKYIIEKKITPLCKTKFDGELVPSNLQVPCYSAKKIHPSGDEVIEPKILAFDIETYNPDNVMDTKKYPIIMIAVYGDKFKRLITWKKFPTTEKNIEFVSSESDMLVRFCELVKEYCPDFLTGYYTDGFDFPYIQDRAKHLKVKLDLGLDGSGIVINGRTKKMALVEGICHLDIYKFIKKVVGQSMQTDSFTLDEVAKELLGEGKHPVDMDAFAKVWDKGGKELDEYAKYNIIDTKLTYDLTKKVLPNLVEFVRILKLPAYDVDRGTFSVYVEAYLMFKASQVNEVILNKPSHTEESQRMHDRIQGAFVYEPTPGFYENICVFDFRSLYPSIIASHNISKGTLNKGKGPIIKTERGDFHFDENKKGFFANVIEELILRRAELKKQLKTSKDPLLKGRSEALKVLANSFYGYMGFAPARWYCIECAESTTAWARHYIHMTIDAAKAEGFNVLYSDTDSIFLLLDKKKESDALHFMEKMNKEFPGLMELDYEGLYPTGIFVGVKSGEGGAKKKYALLKKDGDLKVKGFELVRRNTSEIAAKTQKEVLDIILKEKNPKKAKEFMKKVVEDLRQNKIPKDEVIISTMLTKGIESYAAVGPHVEVAKRMKELGKQVSAGFMIRYVVVKGAGRIREKAKLPEECKQDEYDGEYYVTNQVLPAVERIFDVFGVTVEDLSSKTKQKSLGSFC